MNYTDPANWHEAANLFPLFSPSDLEDLTKDIRDNGLQNPIVLHEGRVLDGRNRLLACKAAGAQPRFEQWNSTLSPVTWVISQNLRRRHLEPGQRAMVAVEAKPLLEAEAKKNQLANLKRGAENPRSSKIVQTGKPIDSGKGVASAFDVSRGYVYAAQKIKETDLKVAEEVKAGILTIPEAERKLGLKDRMRGPVSSESNEWYTPKKYIEAARSVLGTLELDPASCEDANREVQAAAYFTKETDGLRQSWTGKVWLNPPYGDAGPKFIAKLLDAYASGAVSEAIVLVSSHSSEARWFKPLFEHTICFSDHRVKFWNEAGFGDSPAHGSAFVYLGPNHDKFAEAFRQFGSVVDPHRFN